MGAGMQELLTIFVFFFGGVFGAPFWGWMLVDCATNEAPRSTAKRVWLTIVACTYVVGALAYFALRRPRRIASRGQ